MAPEGTNVTLTCKFENANPPVNSVTFFEKGHSKPAEWVSCSTTQF